MESRDERFRVIDALLSKPGPSAALFQGLKLDEVGAKPCSLLLKNAIQHQQSGDWERCHEAAVKAREYAWEQLHSGPSWQAVAQVHRDAYGVAGTLVAVAIFLSGAAGSLDKAVYSLDLVALMAGGRFQAVANLVIEHMEAHAQQGDKQTAVTSRATRPQAPSVTPQSATSQAITATPKAPSATPHATSATPQASSATPQAASATPSATPQSSRATPHAPAAEKTASCTPHELNYSNSSAARLVPTTPSGVCPVEPKLKKSKRDRSPPKGGIPSTAGGVRRIRLPPLHVFQREFMETSTPVILTGVMDGWPAMGLGGHASRDWSKPSYLRALAGRRTVPVEVGGCYTSDGWRQELMTIGDFIGRFIEPKTDNSESKADALSSSCAEAASGEGARSDESKVDGLNPCGTNPPSTDRAHVGAIDDFSGRFIEPSADTSSSACAEAPSADGAPLNESKSDASSNSSGAGATSANGTHIEERVPDNGASARQRRQPGVSGRRETGYLAQHELFDQIPPLRRDIMTPDYCALLLADEEDDGGAESVATNAWFGPGGTVSPLHNDPFHNLLAQVVGSKRVLLVDRKLSASVYPRPGLMTNTSEVDAANPDLSKHPLFAEAMPLLECELRKGEMLYIPPLFWHHIESREVSFSVSFWWGKRRALSEVLPM